MPTEAALLTEYAEVGAHIRHYASTRFARLTLFVALTGGIFVLVWGPSPVHGTGRYAVKGLGVVLGPAFFAMDWSGTQYWRTLVERARQIERALGMSAWEDRRGRVPRKNWENHYNETHAVHALMLALSVFWMATLLSQLRSEEPLWKFGLVVVLSAAVCVGGYVYGQRDPKGV